MPKEPVKYLFYLLMQTYGGHKYVTWFPQNMKKNQLASKWVDLVACEKFQAHYFNPWNNI